MTNLYHAAFTSAHVNNATLSTKNAEKASVLASRLTDDRIVAMLSASNVDVRDMSLALYTCEKTIKLHSYLVNIDRDFCDNLNAALRTCALCYANEVEVTERDIAASILIDVNVSDERKHLVYQRRNRISADAQRQYVIAALRQMQIITETSRNVFKVNANATFLAACASMNVDLDLVDDEEIDALASVDTVDTLETSEIVDSENASA